MGAPDGFEPDARRFVRGARDLLVVAGHDGYFRWINEAWTRMGWELDALYAMPFIELIHTDDVEATQGALGQVAAGERVTDFVNRCRTSSGAWRDIEWHAWPEDDLIYAIGRDVTQYRESLQTMQRQVETLELAEEMGNFGHWRIDVETNALHWSPNIYRIHGLDPNTFEPTLENGIEAYHPDDRDRVQRYVESAMAEKAGWDFRLRLMRADGEERLVHAVGRVQVDESDEREVTGIFGVFQDITEQERAVLQRHAELEQFAYAAAHDLQAPLRTMLGFLELLEDELGDTASSDVQEYLGRLSRSASRMRSLVGELYRYAKAVGTDDRTELVDLRAVAESVVQEREADLRAAGGAVEVGELPSIFGAAGPLSSVFANLVDNAIKYRSKDRPLRVQIRHSLDGPHVRVDIEDNGIGFDPAHAERVFGLFAQLNPADSPGMGVGLALCKKIVERHGGTISARPRAGEGTTVHLRFPRAATVPTG